MAALKAADVILTMADSGRDYRVAVTVLDVESEAQEAETYLVTRPAGGSLTVERWRL